MAHQEELGTQLVELRQHLICDERLKSLQIRVSTLAAKIQGAEKELQQWKLEFETSQEELEKLLKERRCAEAQRLGRIPLTPTVLLQQALLALECGSLWARIGIRVRLHWWGHRLGRHSRFRRRSY